MFKRGLIVVLLSTAFAGFAGAPAASIASAQQIMCMASGEQTSGFNKICYYDCLGSTRAVTQQAISLCALSINAPAPGTTQTPRQPSQSNSGSVPTTCFARGEQTSGMNKICYYDCLGSARAVTQSAISLCPLTIQQ